MLSNEQIESFKEDGVLILPGFFSEQEIAQWRDNVLTYYDHPKTAHDWKSCIMKYSSTNFYLTSDPHPSFHKKMKELYQCFHNRINWTGENELVARRPEIDAEWIGARTPHLDFPVYAPLRTLANTTFYLNDVAPKGGPIMYWKGSHRVAWQYFKEYPQDYMARGGRSQDQVFQRITQSMESEPVAFSANAGDLLIWHSLTLHSPSVNLSNDARIAIIGRWGTLIQENESRFDFSGDLWKEWNFSLVNAKPTMLD